MKKRRVVKRACLASKPPIMESLLFWLILDRFHAPGYAWGIVGTLVVLIWIGFVITLFSEDYRDPFEDIDRR